MNRTQLDTLIKVVSDDLSSLGYRCIEIQWEADTKTLRVFLDHELPSEGQLPFNMDDCLEASRHLNETNRIDESVPFCDSYSLEVSSPGIERPLRCQGDFERYVGHTIEVKLLEPHGNRVHGKGKLVGVGPTFHESVEITIDTNRGPWTFPLSTLSMANLVYDWYQLN